MALSLILCLFLSLCLCPLFVALEILIPEAKSQDQIVVEIASKAIAYQYLQYIRLGPACTHPLHPVLWAFSKSLSFHAVATILLCIYCKATEYRKKNYLLCMKICCHLWHLEIGVLKCIFLLTFFWHGYMITSAWNYKAWCNLCVL